MRDQANEIKDRVNRTVDEVRPDSGSAADGAVGVRSATKARRDRDGVSHPKERDGDAGFGIDSSRSAPR